MSSHISDVVLIDGLGENFATLATELTQSQEGLKDFVDHVGAGFDSKAYAEGFRPRMLAHIDTLDSVIVRLNNVSEALHRKAALYRIANDPDT